MKRRDKKEFIKYKDLCITITLLIAATIIAYIFYVMSQTATNIAIVYILFIVLVSRSTTGYGWGIFASIAGVIAVNYFFTEPFMVIDFAKNGYPITFCGMLAISLLTSTLTTHLKELMRKTEDRHQILEKLNEINNKLLLADNIEQLQNICIDCILEVTGGGVGIWLKKDDSHCVICVNSEQERKKFLTEEARIKRNEAFAGKISKGEEYSYFPLTSHNRVWGVLGIQKPNCTIKQEKKEFLELVCSQIVIALERQQLVDEKQKLETETEKEKMRSNLLRAISHDLRTPLTAIIGASQTCLENSNMTIEEKQKMLEYIYEDSNWLLSMVENLLTVTRMKKDGTCVVKTLEPIEEVIFDAVLRLKKRCKKAEIKLKMPEEILMIPMDPVLIEQVIINLIENAVKHSKSEKPIELEVNCIANMIQVCVRDFGTGIKEEKLKNIFDGYCTTQNDRSDANKGMGIGLSICKTIIFAHGGKIEAHNHDKGAEFVFQLPIKENNEKKRERL